jgi:Ser/Thr protein kinase RdoA (MazF antagonist)
MSRDAPAADSEIDSVLRSFPADCWPAAIRSPGGTGGFSGAAIWRLTTPRGDLCLRRWPREHPTRDRLQWIHGVLRHVGQDQAAPVPVPIVTRTGETIVFDHGHLWELTPWLPGEPDERGSRNLPRLVAALEMLARFHNSTAAFQSRGEQRPAPAVAERLAFAQRLIAGDLAAIERATAENSGGNEPLSDLVSEALARAATALPRVAQSLEAASALHVPMLPVLRDVWRAHVLFQGDRVTGLIDFGAMRIDSAACDIARLLGSMAGSDHQRWEAGLAAYEAVRPLAAAERQLLAVLDESGVLLGALNWAVWLYVEQRRFDDPTAVAERLQELLHRLESAASNVAWHRSLR